MDFQLWILAVFTLGSSVVMASLAPNQGPRPNLKPNPTAVYTAELARQSQPYRPSPTAEAAHVENNEQENDGLGFVEPIDFTSFVRDLGFENDRGGKYTSESKTADSYPEFFNDHPSPPPRNNNPYDQLEADPYTPIKSASTHNSQRQETERVPNDGFVDPNVQFRSLYDAAETDNSGFSPSDFLNYNTENSRREGSKAAQTRSYPSYTYSGRQAQGGDAPPSSQPPRYRSSYRQVDSRENRDRDRDGGGRSKSYGSGNYNGRNDSPPKRPSTRNRYQNQDDGQYNNNGRSKNPQQYSRSSSQPVSDSPSSSRGKASSAPAGKKNCEKIEKEVDYDEGEGGFDPADYDPATYQSRYKRQTNGRNAQKAKRPMTCYVCQDAQGRYAEQCEYDSSADPNKGKDGSYFHSSSTSFTDNGSNKPRGGRERHRRNPTTPFQLNPQASKASDLSPENAPETESLPKRIQKRQSKGNRYAPNFQAANDDDNGRQHNDERDYDDDAYKDPRVPDNRERRVGDVEYLPPSGDDKDVEDDAESPSRDPARELETVFGTPAGFGKERHENSPGFDFDFGIPKEFQNQDVSHSETPNQPAGADFDGFDIGYEDYVKQHFPESGGSSSRSSSSGPSGGSTPTAPSYHQRNPSPNPRYDPSTPLHNPYSVNNNPSYGRGRPPYANAGPSYGSGPPPYERSSPQSYGGSSPQSYGGSSPQSYGGSSSPYGGSNQPYAESGPSYPSSSPPRYEASGPSSSYAGSSSPYGGSSQPYAGSSLSYNSRSPSYEQSPRSSVAYSPSGPSSDGPDREHTHPSHNFSPPPYDFQDLGTENLAQAITQFNQRDRKDCHKVQKGDMTCYVCRDARGMNKEECMYASNPTDPNGGQMQYHEVSEFSSHPPNNQNGLPHPHFSSQSFQIQESKVVVSKKSVGPNFQKPDLKSLEGMKAKAESKVEEKKFKPVVPEEKKSEAPKTSSFQLNDSKVKDTKNPGADYDFDY